MRTKYFAFVIIVALLMVPTSAPALAQVNPSTSSLAPLPPLPNSILTGVETIVGSTTVTPGNFDSVRVLCPTGKVAIGGGIDLGNVLTMVVTSSGPTFAANNERLLFQPDGANPAPVGWQATARNNDTTNKTFKVAVICAAQGSYVFLPAVYQQFSQ